MNEKLNFGCGKKPLVDFINVDLQKGDLIDKSFDFEVFPYPFEDNTFKFILVDNVLEHLEDPRRVLDELHRISQPEGIIKIIVPYYNCKGAFNDATHKHFFNETTFHNMIDCDYEWKENKSIKFKIVKMDLIPTKLGALIFIKKIRKIVSYIFGEVISKIDLELKVIK